VLAVLVVPSVRQRAVVRQPGGETGTFHDREDFYVLFHTKPFAIMENHALTCPIYPAFRSCPAFPGFCHFSGFFRLPRFSERRR
jgi:hypothetical protein